jgi:hypothetical protein
MRSTLLLVAALLLMVAPARATMEEDFHVKTAEDIADLCSTPATDPVYTAAVNFCHGYLVGAFGFYQALMAKPGHRAFVCVPEPKPSRNVVIDRLLAWLKAHPEYRGENPINATFKFLAEAYPCKT